MLANSQVVLHLGIEQVTHVFAVDLHVAHLQHSRVVTIGTLHGRVVTLGTVGRSLRARSITVPTVAATVPT